MGCFKVGFKTIFLIGFFLKVGFGYGQTIIINDDFESGFGNWNAVERAIIVNTSPLNNGRAVLFDNDNGNQSFSITTVNNLNLTIYNSVDFIFDFSADFNNNDGFTLEFSNDGGLNWTEVRKLENNFNFINGEFFVYKVKVKSSDFNFTTTSKFRIRCDVKNATKLYLDNIIIRESNDDYCEQDPGNSNQDDYIRKVQFNTINSSSGNINSGYSDFTGISTDVILNDSHDLAVTVNRNKPTQKKYNLFVWYDWNQDGSFNNTDERESLELLTNNNPETVTKSITIPNNAVVGNTRMRIMLIWDFNGEITACTDANGGEVEDYTINVIGNTITTGTISPTSYCAGSSLSVPFTKTGAFNSGNIFTAQLSSASGSFTSPVNIGTLTSTGPGTIAATIPVGTAAGTGYRIRVISSNPAVMDTNNGTNLTINAVPVAPTIGTITQPTCTVSTGGVVLNGLPSSGTWTLTRSLGGVSTGTGTSTTITGLPGGTYSYTVTNSSGCVSSSSGNIVINTQPTLNIWTGAVSADWNNTENWSCGGIPTSSTNVLIPSSPTSGNYPEIYIGTSVGLANDIEIESVATLTVFNNSLKINGTLLLNGNIELEGEAQLIQTTGSILDTASSGSIEIDQQGVASTYAYNYWCSPVGTDLIASTNSYSYKLKDILYDDDGASASRVKFVSGLNGALGDPVSIANRWIYKYANKTGTYSEWQQIGSTGDINAGQGFSMKGPNPTAAITVTQNYTFKGKPNNGTILLPVGANNEYLVGNPYPSALDTHQFIDDNSPSGTGSSITGTLLFWEQYDATNHNLANYQGGYAIMTKAGAVGTTIPSGISGLGTPTKTPQRYIPVGQGFFVTGDNNGGDIVFNNGQRIFITEASGDAVFMKPSNTKNKTANDKNKDVRPKFRLGFEAPQITHRQLLLTIDENTTNGVDWGYEGKINGMATDDMYWNLADDKYVIQALPDANIGREVPLGIIMNKTGLASIKIDALENVDESVGLYIKDAFTGKTHQINTQAFEIALDAGTYVDRFSLTFSPQNVLGFEVDILKQGVHVFMNNTASEIQIRNTVQAELLSVKLFNSIGQLQSSWNKNLDNQNISLPINNKATGVYLVQINTTTGTISKKLVIE